ncbi:hypothetical protein EHI8A_152850 [Entamoeba histolytica HM-1:IMSS-B]|uniref:Cullin family profile domain-containing protein n=6 Tax=Entamoeba histolytica TaxID=5759 RepID=C4MAF5_ENTH1|nr:hypothetical protein EHI_167350 [Entamoeba histolytica HM-1:IMSS]EMD44221.1 Hypothetical protein EHI5A_181800 [Entamoeba histolytica KU27]EMH73934.1 hypothetical protein EHI8A_152850 [Entamoeba histolytica HM-1:IMSS-B]EMS16588.1 hypothetical protein KM1_229080 [Entamoeba histolytica HM-3:IMSS]ENY59821.1 hypothetical protein EHI7A_138280 [Entamoeba histolytica HM-1:IMSS-A]GAT98782.1 hypothetical protein CL6EHI_167350 [Entamoeba histolytica]|eukprot:XP_650367.1 hypothetical protein EHI_167350 [Entamoeba histolytica HM-1:IMSS]
METQTSLDSLINQCLIADTLNFFSLFHQICFQVNQRHFETIHEQALLYNKLFDVFPLLLKQTLSLLTSNSGQGIPDILISTLRLIRTFPFNSIVSDITSDLLHEIVQYYLSQVDSLHQLNVITQLLIPFYSPNFNQQIALLYFKKYIPQLPHLIISTSLIPQFVDFQEICHSNKLLANYCVSKIIELFKFDKNTNSKVFLISLMNSMKNLCIIDGSLQLCKMCFEIAFQSIHIVLLSDFLQFLQQENLPDNCFHSEQWDLISLSSPSFIPLPPEYIGKIPIQIIKTIAQHYGEQLLIEYENGLASKLLHCGLDELQALNHVYQFLQKNVFGEDCPGQVMFNDVQKSLAEMKKTKTFNTLIISPAYWPELNSIKYTDLEEIKEKKKEVIRNYKSNHPKQILTFQQAGVVKLNYTNLKGVVTYHVVTPLQATVLITITKEENGILLNELEHKLGLNETMTSNIVMYWLEQRVISASDYMGSILLHKE